VWLTGSDKATISAVFIRQVVPDAAGTATVSDGAMRAMLEQ